MLPLHLELLILAAVEVRLLAVKAALVDQA
jgi:hypothetical protein